MRQPVPFGKYLLLERISVGGMAEVFKAKSFGVEGFEKILAIKRILPSMTEDADFISMFIDEAKIAGQLNHANVAQIFELGKVDEAHFIAMEFVWGKDLLQLQNRFRRQKQTMPFAMAAFIISKVCEGLDYAHKKKDATGKSLNIIHRDVSPQNVLVSYDGEVKVIDFGIAKAASRSTKTQAGVLKGKFGYMSPEQVRGLPLDRRSDIFAIATILYELLTAERLFLGESDFSTLEKVRNVDIPPPSQVVPGCPPAIERIILKGLAKEVDDRYQWGSEMQEDLLTYLNQLDPPFAMKQLSLWMREQFNPEMKRESQLLEEQRRLTREAFEQVKAGVPLNLGPPPAAATPAPAKPPAPSFGAPVKEATNLLEVDDLIAIEGEEAPDVGAAALDKGDIHGEATQIATEMPPEVKALIEAGGLPGSSTPPPIAGESTQILGANHPLPTGPGSGDAAPTDIPAQATMILDGPGAPGLAPIVGQSTMILQAPVYPAPRPVTASVAVLPARPSVVVAPAGGSQLELNPPTSHVDRPLPYARPRRSTLGKDIGIGVAVAVVMIAGVLGAKVFLFRKPAVGTVVVTVNPAGPAHVLLDGEERGGLSSGAMTLKEVPAGAHRLQVRGEAGAYDAPLNVIAGDVTVVAATLQNRPSEGSVGGMGRLRLALREEGAQVFVDGAQLDDGAWKEPIPLRAGKAHEIRVAKAKFEEARFTVTLAQGEERTRAVALEALRGHLVVKSVPDGAEVTIDGKVAGKTPFTADDLDPEREVKVVVKRAGQPAVARTVSFAKESRVTVEIDLAGGVAAAAEKPAAEEPPAKAEPKAEPAVARAERPGKPGKGEKPPKDEGFAMVAERPEKAAAGKGKHDDDEEDDELAPVQRPAKKVEAPPPAAPAPKAPPKAAASGESGFLVANTQPWAKVIIDGKDTGQTTPIAPRSKIPLKAGKHRVTFVANGKKFDFDIEVKAGEDFRLIKQLAE